MRLPIKNCSAAVCLLAVVSFLFSAPTRADDVKLTPERIQKLLGKNGQTDTENAGLKRRVDPAALVVKALRFARAKQYEKAIRILRAGGEKFPDSALAHYNLAWIYGETGKRIMSFEFHR